jgi:hypothetical protein
LGLLSPSSPSESLRRRRHGLDEELELAAASTAGRCCSKSEKRFLFVPRRPLTAIGSVVTGPGPELDTPAEEFCRHPLSSFPAVLPLFALFGKIMRRLAGKFVPLPPPNAPTPPTTVLDDLAATLFALWHGSGGHASEAPPPPEPLPDSRLPSDVISSSRMVELDVSSPVEVAGEP